MLAIGMSRNATRQSKPTRVAPTNVNSRAAALAAALKIPRAPAIPPLPPA